MLGLFSKGCQRSLGVKIILIFFVIGNGVFRCIYDVDDLVALLVGRLIFLIKDFLFLFLLLFLFKLFSMVVVLLFFSFVFIIDGWIDAMV